MTLEEAIKVLKQYQGYDPMFPDGETLKHAFDLTDETVDTLLTALRPVSREQVEKVWRGCKYCDEEWGTCNPITNRFTMPPRGGIRFCPMCGRPLTDEAVQMVMERLEALKAGKADW